MHWDDNKDLVPSGFLNVDVTKSQHQLFNPNLKNVLTGFIMYYVKAGGANNKLVWNKIDIIEENIDI